MRTHPHGTIVEKKGVDTTDCADENNAEHERTFADWTNQQFRSPSHRLPLPHSLGKQYFKGVNTWMLTTDYSTCEAQWCIYCTQVPPLYTRLLHTQPWSDNGLPPSIH